MSLFTPLDVPRAERKRFRLIENEFRKHHDGKPDYFAGAPGRVNIIGEHVDHQGYGVLPMAIQQSVIIACKRNTDNSLNIANSNDKFEFYGADTKGIKIDGTPKWYNYVLCGWKAVLESFNKQCHGLDMLVDGNVPQAAGLSSSSALVCASALAFGHSLGMEVSREDMAEACRKGEYHIGTQGGGMDQAISFNGVRGCATHIEFAPLRCVKVTLPSDVRFVVAHSCAELNKAATSQFNERVVELRIAAKLLAHKQGLDAPLTYAKLKPVQETLCKTLPQMVELVQTELEDRVYAKEELISLLGCGAEFFNKDCLLPNTQDMKSFQLRKRALHVFSEAARVLEFVGLCSAAGDGLSSQLGALMTASHASCRDDFECSHPDLDQLTKCCLEAGALGSRLTGAGWGGCTVSMVPAGSVNSFMHQIVQSYYVNHLKSRCQVSVDAIQGTLVFATEPNDGACLYKSTYIGFEKETD